MHVLIVGGGHASLPLLARARGLVRRGAEVTLISDCPHLWYSGMTPEYLGRVYPREDVTIDLSAICTREGVRFVSEPAVALDAPAREVETASGARFFYDVCAVDVGAANPAQEAAGPAVRTKPLHKIGALRAFLSEVASGASDETRRLVIVGGGAAGVEVALNLSARPDLKGRLELSLVEPSGALLSAFPRSAQRWAYDTLRQRQVDVRLGSEVDRVEPGAVRLASSASVPADRVLWATGSVGHAWLAEALDADARGFVRVHETLQAHRFPRVFVAGDAAVVDGHEDLARVGVHAVKQGPTLARNVETLVDALASGEAPEAASLTTWRPYPVAPLILSTGTHEGLFVAGPLALRGAWALALKHRVDRKWIEPYLTAAPSWAGHLDLRAAEDAVPFGPRHGGARG
ncbi:NAD(P)/FAD-dependent oxidoreductase [Rubricoccus marinus]|uniref:FAD/NAD(P)-binding domain-containing protein n=1 Tax=Rubricoccus marinus TaxID=716817 RepID=A0A259U0G4_9BACT|nr:FAD-dependent oxidoreductase [Rubricoccus marinus]OZC03314.1 hypothetical protein BSZ36_10170 [Rubricoccus marinus]